MLRELVVEGTGDCLFRCGDLCNIFTFDATKEKASILKRLKSQDWYGGERMAPTPVSCVGVDSHNCPLHRERTIKVSMSER